VGILACDHVGDELWDAAGRRDYHQMYDEMLRGAEPSIRTRTYHVVDGELPDTPHDCDAWIVTGSRHDAYRDEGWIVALRGFVHHVRTAEARLVGICFGHQLVAHALGGVAEPAGEWRAGPQRLHVEPTPWFAGGTVVMHAMHQDVARRIPDGARTIGRGETAEHPIYLVGETILCMQDHPEFDTRFVAALVEQRRGRLGSAANDAADRLARHTTDNALVARWIADFLLDRRRPRENDHGERHGTAGRRSTGVSDG
jgi:GMP synthase-like glutamine amidotransferase